MIPDNNFPEDTIPVRSDEAFDENQLMEYLKGKLKGSNSSLKVRQFWGGAANLTYLLDFNGIEYVLRRPPIGSVAKTSHDMEREFRVLSVLYKSFPYAPRAFLFCNDSEIIGAPFFVMERKRGYVIRRSFPSGFPSNSLNIMKRISEAMVDRLVEFHSIDYKKIGLMNLGQPERFIKRQIEGWWQRWQNAKMKEIPEMEIVYNWLRDNIPSTKRYSLVHNDYKLDNIILDKEDPGRIEAIFDWDMTTLGDPLADLGTLLTYWSDPDDPPHLKVLASMPIGKLGFLTRSQIIERYAERSNIPSYELDIKFYHTLGLFRLTGIIAQIYIRWVRKQTKDQRFELLGNTIPLIAQVAKEVALDQFKMVK